MFKSGHSINIHSENNLRTMMQWVILATLPGLVTLIYFFGWGVLINVLLASVTALCTEATILILRKRPWREELKDSSALVTAVLLGLALPPLAPWWITVIAVFFAIAFAKHLYGGLGSNPFNPAMVGYVLVLISFPLQMTAWSPAESLWPDPLDFTDTLRLIFTGHTSSGITLELFINGADGFSTATPLDHMKTMHTQGLMTSEILTSSLYNGFAGIGWIWVNLSFVFGGLYLLWKKCIAWQLTVGMITGILLMAVPSYFIAPDTHATPLIHLLSGGTMLGAFFIVTDPITAATSNKGRWIYAMGVGILIWIIRSWGGYPDAIAFSILLMNMAAPTIDHYTRPLAYGEKSGEKNNE